LPAAISGWLNTHQPRVLSILHIPNKHAIFDQGIFA